MRTEQFRIYNVAGYMVMLTYFAAATFIHPLDGDYVYSFIVSFVYFMVVWLTMGFYLGDVVHLGLAHRSLDVKPWFLYFVSYAANTIGIYLNPVTWSNRHRLHHTFSDKQGDPNKLESDGFFKTFYLMLFPYPSVANLATEPIFQTIPMRLVSNRYYAVLSQFTSFIIPWMILGDWAYTLILWIGVRVITAYVHIVQNYWTHDRRFGSRRYDDSDNAMNIGNWIAVTLTFSACWQNNHHHAPRFVRLSHDPEEYDFGFMTVRLLYKLGLVKPTKQGLVIPEGANLREVGLS